MLLLRFACHVLLGVTFGLMYTACKDSPAAPTELPGSNDALFADSFGYGDGLVTNEFAYWNPLSPAGRRSLLWEMTSGSLFARDGAGWTGVPDNVSPNALSANGTNSAVFRFTTANAFSGSVRVALELLNLRLVSTPSTPALDLDGAHIFLRYVSEQSLYYASMNRRDNRIVIKKKVPGGPSNGGTYHDLSPYASYPVPYGVWQTFSATIATNGSGSVTIDLFLRGERILSAIDSGVGGPPITSPGKFGIRGDNAELKFRNFVLTRN